ncbi:MAG: hypothetical protein Q8R30_01790 [bacterium]|nr:hypothetical protein [bacterium]MDZ4285361.1 hypothetical protein [Candidatus Sungbacteria bacterium]
MKYAITPVQKILFIVLFMLIGGMTLFLVLRSNTIAARSQRSDGAVGASVLTPKDLASERERLFYRFDEVGGVRVYAELKEKYAASSFDVQHAVAHIFGEVLYEKMGIEGVAVCDGSFAFGCYHSFFGKAISEKGMAAVGDLDKACIRKYGPLGTGCQHGIGHGLLEYTGPGGLAKALDGCMLTTQVKELFGCTSGIFMEYNIPVLTSGASSSLEPRKFDAANPYAPCNTTVLGRFRKSCYYELSQWWDKVLGGDYGKLGVLCSGITSAEYKEFCFLGVGNIAAPSSQYDVAKTIEACSKMPNDEDETLCRAGASWSFFAAPEKRSLAPAVCEGIETERQHYCIKKSDLIGNGEKNASIKSQSQRL